MLCAGLQAFALQNKAAAILNQLVNKGLSKAQSQFILTKSIGINAGSTWPTIKIV